MNVLKNILQGIGLFFLYAFGTIGAIIGLFLFLAVLINYSLIILPIVIVGLIIYAAVKKVQDNNVD